MSTNHNRIKVSDLETNERDKILSTNSLGELEFMNVNDLKAENYNALDYIEEGKALDARQGKVLKDYIDSFKNGLKSYFDSLYQSILVSGTNIKTICGIPLLGSGSIDADILEQVIINSSTSIQESWKGRTVLIQTSCTITVPASLSDSFAFQGITMPGVTITWQITAPKTWLFGSPNATLEKSTFSFIQKGTTNSIILLQ
ncbi:hypothetical protein [Flavobacterium sp. ASV13]|uniref:hypothetical protein n=1 Tax=Flavobacterium sp. ASV13 TaxID=1506583 RepID=UPI00054EEB72|nr:hypothetical protein [Flavobacterium sp. ASV13]